MGTYKSYFCHSMNTSSVVGISWGGGDTHTLPYAKEFVWTYCIQRRWGEKNFGRKGSHPRATRWNFHYLIFCTNLPLSTDSDLATSAYRYLYQLWVSSLYICYMHLFQFHHCLSGNEPTSSRYRYRTWACNSFTLRRQQHNAVVILCVMTYASNCDGSGNAKKWISSQQIEVSMLWWQRRKKQKKIDIICRYHQCELASKSTCTSVQERVLVKMLIEISGLQKKSWNFTNSNSVGYPFRLKSICFSSLI